MGAGSLPALHAADDPSPPAPHDPRPAGRFGRCHGIALEELLGPAYEGLCKAAIGFEHARGHRPSSTIVPKVKGELLHHLRDTGFALRISHCLRELWMKARRPLELEGLERGEG